MNKLTPTSLFKFNSYRCLSTTQIALSANKPKKTQSKEGLMENAPDWDETNATESEADVKADKIKDVDPEVLKKVTEEYIKSHNDHVKK